MAVGVLKRSSASALAPGAHSLLRMQQQLGNRHVQRILRSSEQAAAEPGAVPAVVQRSIESLRGGGQALDSGVQRRMGQAFNTDFSGVRVHTGVQADRLNRSLAARAFTTGRDVFFRHGEYNPGSARGRLLLAHELTHVLQQNPRAQSKGDEMIATASCNCQTTERPAIGPQTKLTVSRPGDVYEMEADRMAEAYSRWEGRSSQGQSTDAAVHRKVPEKLPEEDEQKEKMAQRKELQQGTLHRQPGGGLEEEMMAKLEGSGVQREGSEEPEEM